MDFKYRDILLNNAQLGPYPLEKLKRVDRPTSDYVSQIKQRSQQDDAMSKIGRGDLGGTLKERQKIFFSRDPLCSSLSTFQHYIAQFTLPEVAEKKAPPAVYRADKDGKEKLLAELKMIVELNKNKMEWIPPIVETVATEKIGIPVLMETIEKREKWMSEKVSDLRTQKMINQLRYMTVDRIGADILAILEEKGIFQNWTLEFSAGESNPYKAVKELDEKLKINWGDE